MIQAGLAAVLSIFLFQSAPALAQALPFEASAQMMEPYLQVSKISTTLKSVEERNLAPYGLSEYNIPGVGLGGLPGAVPFFIEGGDPMGIADVAIKIWDIIKEGAPVVNVESKDVKALPNIANNNWEAMTGWKAERTMTFAVSTENLMGIKTVDLEYQVKLIYGGGVKGKGQYIASARVLPTKVDVMWGYNLDVSVNVPSILNIASAADPLAAINMDVTYKISTVLRSYSEAKNYELQGDGLMKADGKVVYAASSR